MENFIWLVIAAVSIGFLGIIFGPRPIAPWEIDEEVDREFGRL